MVTLRPMEATREDYQRMQDWFAEPELQEFVCCDEKNEGIVPLERIEEKYGSRVKAQKDVFPFFILCDSRPIGFIQYYLMDADTIGLDMWIGVKQERNRGYGTEALRQMVDFIHARHPQIKTLFIDPEVENKRAVRCYEKAGFVHTGVYSDEEGDLCCMMKIECEDM